MSNVCSTTSSIRFKREVFVRFLCLNNELHLKSLLSNVTHTALKYTLVRLIQQIDYMPVLQVTIVVSSSNRG